MAAMAASRVVLVRGCFGSTVSAPLPAECGAFASLPVLRCSVHLTPRSACSPPEPTARSAVDFGAPKHAKRSARFAAAAASGGALSLDQTEPFPAYGGSDDGAGGSRGGGGGGGGGGGDDAAGSGGAGDAEGGPLLDLIAAARILEEKGLVLPEDMAAHAGALGLPATVVQRYLDLQGAPWPLGPAFRAFAPLRNRMLADPTFLFKILTEVVIDSGCATFAEMQKRGDDFWKEFEFYLSDLTVGIALDIALVSMLAPCLKFGIAPPGRNAFTRALAALPNSMFEGALPGQSFSAAQRVATLFTKALQYGVSGFGCGLLGQGVANSLMVMKRNMREGEVDEDEVKVPPLLKTAALWGVFMAISSNFRYQVINGLERVVEGSPITRRVPPLALAFTVAVRFGNNIFGGMQFVDWARLSGVQ